MDEEASASAVAVGSAGRVVLRNGWLARLAVAALAVGMGAFALREALEGRFVALAFVPVGIWAAADLLRTSVVVDRVDGSVTVTRVIARSVVPVTDIDAVLVHKGQMFLVLRPGAAPPAGYRPGPAWWWRDDLVNTAVRTSVSFDERTAPHDRLAGLLDVEVRSRHKRIRSQDRVVGLPEATFDPRSVAGVLTWLVTLSGAFLVGALVIALASEVVR